MRPTKEYNKKENQIEIPYDTFGNLDWDLISVNTRHNITYLELCMMTNNITKYFGHHFDYTTIIYSILEDNISQ